MCILKIYIIINYLHLWYNPLFPCPRTDCYQGKQCHPNLTSFYSVRALSADDREWLCEILGNGVQPVCTVICCTRISPMEQLKRAPVKWLSGLTRGPLNHLFDSELSHWSGSFWSANTSTSETEWQSFALIIKRDSDDVSMIIFAKM